MADASEITVDSGKTFFDISANTDQICMVLKAYMYPGKDSNMPIYAIFGQRSVKKLLTGNQLFTRNGFILQRDEAGKLPIFLMFVENCNKMKLNVIFKCRPFSGHMKKTIGFT